MFVGIGSGLVGGGVQASIQSLLFGLGEPGVLFDPTDLTTLFQDRAGTTPVTDAGQSVGLRLSKDQGLRQGPELVTNGDFSDGSTGWSLAAGWTVTGGGLSINQVGSTIGASQAFSVVAGRTYLLEFDVTAYTSGTLAFGTQTGVSVEFGSVSSARHVRVFGIGGASNSGLRFYSTGAGFVGTIDNVSFKELAGNHQVAVSDAKRGVYGWIPKTGRRNLLTYTEQFDNAAWTKAGSPTLTNQSNGVWRLQAPAGSWLLYQSRPVSGTHNFSIEVKSNGAGLDGFALMMKGVVAGANINATNEWVRYSASGLNDGSGDVGIIRNSSLAAIDVLIRFPQLETGSTATAYQRVVSQYDITEAGVPTCYYVQADGVDDAYVTPTITPNTDKVQVFAGVRKLTDSAAYQVIIESSASLASNNGAFVLAPNVGTYELFSKGTVQASAPASGYSAPVTNVITGLGDISGDTATLRINGTQVAQSTSDQGTGNYLAYPAYIYGRGGTTLPFNGLDFGHAVRFGPNLDAATIARVESLIARNTPEVDFLFGGVWNDGYAWNDNTNWNDGA